jgi:hypothetical protein
MTSLLTCARCIGLGAWLLATSGCDAPSSSSASSAGTSNVTSASPGSSAIDLSPVDQLTWQKAHVLLKSRGCEPGTSRGPGPREFQLQCTTADGQKLKIDFTEFDEKWKRDAMFSMLTEGKVFAERGKQLLVVSIERNGKLDRPASEEMFAAVVAAGRNEDPHVHVKPSGATWVLPRLEKVGTKMVIAPRLVSQLVEAMKANGYSEAMVLSEQGRDTANEKDTGIPNVQVGTSDVRLAVKCDEKASSAGSKPSDAGPGQAIYIHELCAVLATVNGSNGAPDKAQSAALLAKVLASPEPTP